MQLSVIIPSRNEPYLSKTIDDLFDKAEEKIEIIVMLDGYWPEEPITSHDNLILVHKGKAHGMRPNINAAARIASGKYLMKIDAHCIVGEGFDKILIADCEKNCLAVPSRYPLDVEKWQRERRGPAEYLYLTYPYKPDKLYGSGLHGKKWIGKNRGHSEFYKKERENKHKQIDEIMTFQGSCWFMHRDYFFKIGGMDDINYYTSGQEAQELGMKLWMSGGKCVRNKKTWYAHFHKNRRQGGRYFPLNRKKKLKGVEHSSDLWMNNKWSGTVDGRSIQWLIKKFWPVPGWPEEWGADAG